MPGVITGVWSSAVPSILACRLQILKLRVATTLGRLQFSIGPNYSKNKAPEVLFFL